MLSHELLFGSAFAIAHIPPRCTIVRIDVKEDAEVKLVHDLGVQKDCRSSTDDKARLIKG